MYQSLIQNEQRVFVSADHASAAHAIDRARSFGHFGGALELLEAMISKHGRGYPELATSAYLWSRVGDPERAMLALREAVVLARRPSSKIWCESLLSLELEAAGRSDEATRKLTRLLELRDRQLVGERALARYDFATQNAFVLRDAHAWQSFRVAIERGVLQGSQALLEALARRLEGNGTGRGVSWPDESPIEALSDQLTSNIDVLLTYLERPELADAAERGRARRLLARCVPLVFSGVVDDDQVQERWEQLGRYYRLAYGRDFVDRAVARTPPATRGSPLDQPRRVGRQQLLEDLPWLHAAVRLAARDVSARLDAPLDSLGVAALRRDLDRLDRAMTRAEELGLVGALTRDEYRLARIHAALFGVGDRSLESLLREVHGRNDKSLCDNAALLIASAARHLTPQELETALEAWTRNVGTRSSYFNMAYAVLRAGTADRALLIAEHAVRSFPEDADCADELDFLRQRVARIQKPAAGAEQLEPRAAERAPHRPPHRHVDHFDARTLPDLPWPKDTSEAQRTRILRLVEQLCNKDDFVSQQAMRTLSGPELARHAYPALINRLRFFDYTDFSESITAYYFHKTLECVTLGRNAPFRIPVDESAAIPREDADWNAKCVAVWHRQWETTFAGGDPEAWAAFIRKRRQSR